MIDRPYHSMAGVDRAVLGAIAAYAAGLFWLCCLQYRSFGYDDFDLAVHAQTLHNLTRGEWGCSILGMPFLGNHMVLILLLAAPLSILASAPLLLLFLQSALLALAAWPLYLLARRELPPRWGLLIVGAYLLYPPLLFMGLYEFHPVAFVPCFVLFMFLGYREQRFGPFLACLVLALMCQENMGLMAVAFAGYAWIDGRRGRWVHTPFALGVLWLVVAVGLVMPRLNQGIIQFYPALYGYLGDSPGEILAAILRRPWRVLPVLFAPAKIAFLVSLLSPLGFLSLLAPLTLIPDAIILAQRLLSQRGSEASILYHYQAEFIPFIFIAAVYGARRVLRWRWSVTRPALMAVLVAMPVISLISAGVPGRIATIVARATGDDARTAFRRDLVRSIPDDAAVAATFEFLPSLSQRAQVQSLHHIYTGTYTLSDRAYPIPRDLNLLVINTQDRMTFGDFYGPEHFRRIRELIPDDAWSLAAQLEEVVVFRRGGGMGRISPRVLTTPASLPLPAFRTVRARGADAAASLRGLTLGVAQADGAVPLTMYWLRHGQGGDDFTIRLQVRADENRVLYDRRLVPGHRIHPPQVWPVDVVMQDRQVILPREALPPGRFVDVEVAQLSPLSTAAAGGADATRRSWLTSAQVPVPPTE